MRKTGTSSFARSRFRIVCSALIVRCPTHRRHAARAGESLCSAAFRTLLQEECDLPTRPRHLNPAGICDGCDARIDFFAMPLRWPQIVVARTLQEEPSPLTAFNVSHHMNWSTHNFLVSLTFSQALAVLPRSFMLTQFVNSPSLCLHQHPARFPLLLTLKLQPVSLTPSFVSHATFLRSSCDRW